MHPDKPLNSRAACRVSMTRRGFCAGAGAAAALLALPVLPARAGPLTITARPGEAQLADPPAGPTGIWGYQGGVPGPVLKVKRGEEVWVRLHNGLPDPTTIHWHGIRIANAMDGVAGLTQAAVEPEGMFEYRFKAPDAGTFWYHPHNRSWEQLARGLYGGLIVEEDEPPEVDQDLLVIADDWLLDNAGQIHEQSLGALHDRAHAGRLGNTLTLNARPVGRFPVVSGERVRLRLASACNARILQLRFEDLKPVVIALDGQPVTPYPLEHEVVELAPAQRVDLLIDMTGAPGAENAITEVSQQRLVAGSFVYHADKTREPRKNPVNLPDNGLAVPAGSKRHVDLVMTGGAMGRLEAATFDGRELDIRTLAREHGMVWAFNGVAGMTETPLFTARLGESVALRMVNDTRWPHAMHIHGHHFREAGGPWRDTVLVEAAETRTVEFVADNPGKWMIHCHMLEHQAGGMGTWFQVIA